MSDDERGRHSATNPILPLTPRSPPSGLLPPRPKAGNSSSPLPSVSDLTSKIKRVVSFNDVSVLQENSTATEEDSVWTLPQNDELRTRRLAVVMCGLPARGKSHIAKSLTRYLNWLGFPTRIFNVGEKRRATLGPSQPAAFFDPKNEENVKIRWNLALDTLNDMIEWLEESSTGGLVGLYDATNATSGRRAFLREELEIKRGFRVLFLESVCRDESIVDRNVLRTKAYSPDYAHVDPETAVRDFWSRIRMYESTYETLDEAEACSYIKVIDVGRKLVLNDIRGFIPSKIVGFLLNSHVESRSVYLTRHGESKWNVTGQLGGDSDLSHNGREFAKRLAKFVDEEFRLNGREMPLVWTSQMMRTRQTASLVSVPMKTCWRALNEIDAGVCEGMTYEEVKAQMPDVHQARANDKLRFRYPQGESYVDVIHRLEPVVLEIERQKGPILIVAHQAILRALYGFMVGSTQEEVPKFPIPLHTIFKLTTRP